MQPDPVTFASSFKAVKTPVCGNGVREAGEICDDGNDDDTDDCPLNCSCPVESDQFIWSPHQNFCEGSDNEIIYSDRFEFCTAGSDSRVGLSQNGDLDDILLIIPAGEAIRRSGVNYFFPEEHLMIVPNSGIINGSQKVFHNGKGRSLSCSSANRPCFADDFRANEFNLIEFGDTISVDELERIGLTERGIFSSNFRLVHITAGCGHAIDIGLRNFN
jgi:hypothetical protein